MLGSAISKRWVVSLALVGLVSLFMASYGAVWSSSASATSTTIPPDLTFAGLESSLGPDDGSATYVPGASSSASATLRNADGVDITNTAPSMTYAWAVTSSCMTFGSPSAGITDFTVSSEGCTGVLTLTVEQASSNTTVWTQNVTVNAPVPAASVVPVSNSSTPATLPSGIDGSQVSEIKAGDGGTLSVDAGDNTVSLNVAGGSLNDGEAASVSIRPISNSSVPVPPPSASEGPASGTFRFGSTVVQITWYDKDGGELDTKKLSKPAEVCMTYTQADVDNSHGGRDGLGIWRHNGVDWIELNSTVYTNPNRICANTTSFSPFTVGLEVAPPTTTEVVTGLPATGDYAPGVNGLLLALFAGFALVGTGVFTARRARRVRENS
jgi:hypothetical protein